MTLFDKGRGLPQRGGKSFSSLHPSCLCLMKLTARIQFIGRGGRGGPIRGGRGRGRGA